VVVLLVHPGGPIWAKRDAGAWSIPKGEVDGDPDEETARREFTEELGSPPPSEGWVDLGVVAYRSGKRVRAWAVPGDFDVSTVRCNTFEMEWPPRSGRRAMFPEVDRAAWFTVDQARDKLVPAQVEFLDRLLGHLAAPSGRRSGSDEP
jgi:predicted NUDIX family NTP pyrophosphohydrolase